MNSRDIERNTLAFRTTLHGATTEGNIMKILAFDTALNACSIAITDETDILAHVHEKRRRGHAEILMPTIEALMR
ncbi:MAG: hypothetical protein WD185_06315, partial [Sneathiella sp.]